MRLLLMIVTLPIVGSSALFSFNQTSYLFANVASEPSLLDSASIMLPAIQQSNTSKEAPSVAQATLVTPLTFGALDFSSLEFTDYDQTSQTLQVSNAFTTDR